MTVHLFTTYAPVIVTGACAVFAALFFLAGAQRAALLDHAMDKARRDAAFTQWARWTFISISDSEGSLYYRSLYDLQDEPGDLVWTFPRTVILFHALPDDPEPYKEITHG